MSGYPIVWSPRTKDEFAEILGFIEVQFGSEIAADCVLLVETMIDKIAVFPGMFAASGGHNIRRAVVQKNLSIFYRFQRDQVDILKVWDNRCNPEDLRL
ncbi:MAG: type II toxin-antitoxin system RelE/ParE family toxin [Lewinellaceae bacterium]|nr:type II toxin-antitoxin system RelE/ParE family toxin [Lewinellaceae bacterium]